jgi:hypothetical protein
MAQQVLNAIPSMPGVPRAYGRDALHSSRRLAVPQRIIEEQLILLPTDLYLGIQAFLEAQIQQPNIHVDALLVQHIRPSSRLHSDPILSAEADDTPPSTSRDISQIMLVSTETTIGNTANRSRTKTGAVSVCSPRPGPSVSDYQPRGKCLPDQDQTHRRFDMSNASTATVQIDPQPPQSSSGSVVGIGSDGDTSSDVDGNSSCGGESFASYHGEIFVFDDDGNVELDDSGFEEISFSDCASSGDENHIDDAADVDHANCADTINDGTNERSDARSRALIRSTHMAQHSNRAYNFDIGGGRGTEGVRVTAARPQHLQPARSTPSPASLSVRRSTEMGGVTGIGPLNCNRIHHSSAETNHVYKVLKPSRNPMRKRLLLVNGRLSTHN